MMGHGHRNMYRLTGLPGWMRFGYSPGWGGTPPCAQYLSQTGQLSQAMDWFQQQAGVQSARSPHQIGQQPIGPTSQIGSPAQMPQVPREQEIQILEDQLGFFEDQINQIKDRLDQLKNKK